MRPLEGLTVVALEQAVAAPLATRHLADLGARVIKVERPGVGDFARSYDTTVNGMASHFVWLNRSKESLTLNLKEPDAERDPVPAAGSRGRIRPEPCAWRGGAPLARIGSAAADLSGARSSATSPGTATRVRTATRKPTTC